jgi:hypothetical protein
MLLSETVHSILNPETLMADTVKIPRPKFPRRPNGPTGRTEHDARGNAYWARTRATDSDHPPDVPELAINDEGESKPTRRVNPKPARGVKPKRG